MDDAATRSDRRREGEEDDDDDDDDDDEDDDDVDGKWRRPAAMRDESVVDGAAVKDRESAARRTMEAAATTMGDGVFIYTYILIKKSDECPRSVRITITTYSDGRFTCHHKKSKY